MPYIKNIRRDELCAERVHEVPQNAGELNYVLTREVREYLYKHGLNYQTCNDIVGALDNCKHEFRRRIQDDYENKKILENGDLY